MKVTFHTCGSCGKTTKKNSKGKTNKISIITIPFTDLGIDYRQEYHEECFKH